MWFSKKKHTEKQDLNEIRDDIKRLEVSLDMLETNFRIFCKKFNTKLGKLPTETKTETAKDTYNKMFLQE